MSNLTLFILLFEFDLELLFDFVLSASLVLLKEEPNEFIYFLFILFFIFPKSA